LLGSIAEWKRQGNLFLKTDESSPRVSPSHFFLPSLEEVFGHAHHTFLHDFELFVESAYQQFEQQSSQYGSRPSSARTQEENWRETLAHAQEENWQKKLARTQEENWQEKLRELESFKKEHGHVQIPDKYSPNQPLSTWLSNQRKVCLNDDSSNKLKCAATRERRRQQLQSLGVTFPFEQPSSQGRGGPTPQDEIWQEKFRELESFKKEHGHVQIPHKYPPNQPLSTWLRDQRYYKLNEDSSKKLKCAATRERRRQQLRSLGVTFPIGPNAAHSRKRTSSDDYSHNAEAKKLRLATWPCASFGDVQVYHV
jgi:hypothetical protein